MSDRPRDQLPLHGVDPLQGVKLFVRKRDGRVEEFNEARIALAIESAFKATQGIRIEGELPPTSRSAVKKCAETVVERVLARAVKGEEMQVERIQDAVEEQLMVDGHLGVARRYILYRETRRQVRMEREGKGTQHSVSPEDSISHRTSPAIESVTQSPTLLQEIYAQVLPGGIRGGQLEADHRAYFNSFVEAGQYNAQLSEELLDFDFEQLSGALRLERDGLFPVAGLRLLHDEYLLRDEERCIETPQYFWMRVAMGLALKEGYAKNERAIEFYEVLSTLRFLPSKLILAHAGTGTPDLISCFTSTSWSDVEHVRAHVGARRLARDTSGLTCTWLEPWHSSIWDFLQRPKVGEPIWKQDINKAIWIPDLFMRRVAENGKWTLFNPSDVPDLHQLHGRAFDKCYEEYEQKAERGELPFFKHHSAKELWREILASAAQTGQPWIGFKDTVNVRASQHQAGVVHTGNLCTSILLQTSSTEAAACAVGSIHLPSHILKATAGLDFVAVKATIKTAMRMLDNAFDISSYPDTRSRETARCHRPVELGMLGLQEALERLRIRPDSEAAMRFADESAELLSHCAILASTELATERGTYPDYHNSKWSLGLLPIDTIALLSTERTRAVNVTAETRLNWDTIRDAVRRDGMRHCVTTGISNIEIPTEFLGATSAFQIEPQLQVECAARRQKWLDMGQSLTLHTTASDMDSLSRLYTEAWEKGIKTIRQLLVVKKDDLPQPSAAKEIRTPLTIPSTTPRRSLQAK